MIDLHRVLLIRNVLHTYSNNFQTRRSGWTDILAMLRHPPPFRHLGSREEGKGQYKNFGGGARDSPRTRGELQALNTKTTCSREFDEITTFSTSPSNQENETLNMTGGERRPAAAEKDENADDYAARRGWDSSVQAKDELNVGVKPFCGV
ncbi:uncharacterized protein PAC_04674 [Phialocephala subalpina]|uniref:Uncharacterized protein n=1 Tax=Phialocephala subalpina TaxID=576137 RepID=A0A1L7WPU0_9HELO|nr:uncharacterized protein PAC_04674 [Phialocephala subalpina]